MGVAIALYTVTGFFVLPAIIKSQLLKRLPVLTHRRAIVQEVKVKLPVLDSILGGLDEAAKRLFNASRYGEWLNQTIPCGAIGNGPNGALVPSNDPCITGAGSAGLSQSQGAAAISQLLGQGLSS